MKRQVLEIPLGYSIAEETHRVSFEDARDLLLTKKWKKYTKAERDDTFVYLTRHYIACPFCGSKTPAYARYLNKSFNCGIPYLEIPISEKAVFGWTTSQISVFDDEFNTLYLNCNEDITTPLVCPECKNLMIYDPGKRRVEIRQSDGMITVRSEVLDAQEILSLPYISNKAQLTFPLYETAIFDFKEGHTSIGVQDEKGTLICCKDVTFKHHGAWSSGLLYRVIASNKYVRRAIKKAFEEEWGKEIPFFVSEFGIREMQLTTRFVGYDKNFYSAIPFREDSLCLDGRPGDIEKNLRFSKNAHLVYEDSHLPKMKSVRRVFFENAALLFYIRECEELWRIVDDPNYFVKFLGFPHIFIILSELRVRPAISIFFMEFAKRMGVKKFLKLLNERSSAALEYAVQYVSLADSFKEIERAKWKDFSKKVPVKTTVRCTVPLHKPNPAISNCCIDGYEFTWLKTSADYAEAGKALSNCLSGWSLYHSPVVCIKRDGKIVGAAEIDEKCVFQAYAAHNEFIENDPELHNVYMKWFAKNKLCDLDFSDIDDIEDFPF